MGATEIVLASLLNLGRRRIPSPTVGGRLYSRRHRETVGPGYFLRGRLLLLTGGSDRPAQLAVGRLRRQVLIEHPILTPVVGADVVEPMDDEGADVVSLDRAIELGEHISLLVQPNPGGGLG